MCSTTYVDFLQTVVFLMSLMSRRTKVAYDAIFAHLLQVTQFHELKVIMTDFEGPMRTSVFEHFGLHPKGCNVHYDRVTRH